MAGKSPAFLFFADNWVLGTIGMSYEDQGVFLRMLCFQWSNGPGDANAYANACGEHMRTHVERILSSKFECIDGVWLNRRLESERAKLEARSEKARKSANTRWSSEKSHFTPRKEDEGGMRSHSPSMAPSICSSDARGHAPAMLSNSNSNSKVKEDLPSLQASSSKIDQPNSTPSSREDKTKRQSGRVEKNLPSAVEEHIPEPLRTPDFQNAWQRWLDFRLAVDGRLNPIQQQLQLKTCVERGVENAVKDLEASILGGSKGQIFQHDRFARPKKESKAEGAAAFPKLVTFGCTQMRVTDAGIALCPFAAIPVEVARVDLKGRIVEWLVDQDYREVIEEAANTHRDRFVEAFYENHPELVRADHLQDMLKRKAKTAAPSK